MVSVVSLYATFCPAMLPCLNSPLKVGEGPSPNPTSTWNNLQRNRGTNLVSTTNPFWLTNPTLTRKTTWKVCVVFHTTQPMYPGAAQSGKPSPWRRRGSSRDPSRAKKNRNPKRLWRRSCSRGYGLDLRTNCRSLWQPRLFVLLGLTSKTT